MIALSETIQRFSIPPQPFLDLLVAFEQDQRVTDYDTYEQLLAYCRYSANPVGRLVLYLCEAYDDESARLSDCICTGLQLANFWQDVARDLDRGRIYLPREDRERFGYTDGDLRAKVYNEALRNLLRFQVDRARQWFDQGLPLVRRVPRSVRVDVELFIRGGLAILEKIEAADYNVWQRRPVLTRWDHVRLLGGCAARDGWQRVIGNHAPAGRQAAIAQSQNRAGAVPAPSCPARASRAPDLVPPSAASPPEIAQSYAYCERLARRTAKNFYYAFLPLPPAKRRAMSALYAFLRTTDDIGDADVDIQVRRARLTQWRDSLSEALNGRYDHPGLAALHHTAHAYAIPPRYLYEALEGVEMDLGPVRYQTFEDLCRYCYRVASAVGLACIHVWGFRGDLARGYARDCGIAFQLTNILRDLKEDAQRGRIYLPQEDLDRFHYSAGDLRAGVVNEPFRRLMRFQVARARRYYRESAKLEPLLAPVARPVFRTMHGIYAGILQEIERRGYDVFHSRVALPSSRKAAILIQSCFGARTTGFTC